MSSGSNQWSPSESPSVNETAALLVSMLRATAAQKVPKQTSDIGVQTDITASEMETNEDLKERIESLRQENEILRRDQWDTEMENLRTASLALPTGSYIDYNRVPGADTDLNDKCWDADGFLGAARPTDSPTPSDCTTSSQSPSTKSLDNYLNSFPVVSFVETKRTDSRKMRFEEVERSTARTGVIIYDDHVSVVSNPNAPASDEERDDDACVANDGGNEDDTEDNRTAISNDVERNRGSDLDSDSSTSCSSSTDSSKSPIYYEYYD